MFASSFIINEQKKLSIVLTNVLNFSLVLFSSLYILLLSLQLLFTCCHTPVVISVALANMHMGEETWAKIFHIYEI